MPPLIDAFGNVNESGSPYMFNPTYSNTINRISSVGSSSASYDSDGNALNDTIHTYTWDVEGHPLTVDSGQSYGVSLTFDAFGRMVEQHRTAGYTQIAYSPNGHKLALLNGATLQKAMVPLPGNAFAIYSSSGQLYYAHPDLLGSIRLATTPGRALYFETAYTPFGDTYASKIGAGGMLDPAYTGQMGDTGQRQDTVGQLYDFPAREYSTQGRWASPDPARLSATCPKDPQTQNRYAYVRGNPGTYTDPTGMDGACADDPFCGGGDWCDPWWGDCWPPRGPDRFVLGGGGPVERPRPFPWPQLPLGFFGALNNNNGSDPRETRCAKQATKLVLKWVTAAGLLDATILGICAGACALGGPGWPACMAGCVEAVVAIDEPIFYTCLALAVIDFATCERKGPR